MSHILKKAVGAPMSLALTILVIEGNPGDPV